MITLFQTVQEFALLTQALPDAALERPWKWGEYDEGVRFAFFRVYEELSTLAARQESAQPATTVRGILTRCHTAYYELQAVLLGVSDALAAQAPAEGEWPLRGALAHLVQADRGFFATCFLSLDHIRQGRTSPFEMSEEVWNDFWKDAPFAELAEKGSFNEIQAYHARLHERTLQAFTDVTDAELRLPIPFWEGLAPLEFRLHRFHSHMRQHTVQIEKTLTALEHPLSEARQLLRLIYRALGAAEGAAIGAGEAAVILQAPTSVEIARLTEEVRVALG